MNINVCWGQAGGKSVQKVFPSAHMLTNVQVECDTVQRSAATVCHLFYFLHVLQLNLARKH